MHTDTSESTETPKERKETSRFITFFPFFFHKFLIFERSPTHAVEDSNPGRQHAYTLL
jgi:hypothetical protein